MKEKNGNPESQSPIFFSFFSAASPPRWLVLPIFFSHMILMLHMNLLDATDPRQMLFTNVVSGE